MDDDSTSGRDKSLLDALYEEGIIPTYSFPKNVVSTYIVDANGRSKYEVDRGLDIAISEYAPGRSIVVNKDTYQIGGLYYPGSEKRHGRTQSPARAFIDHPNYLKPIIKCRKCQWFGIEDESIKVCPFCGEPNLQLSRNMLRPWGFAPRNAEKMPSAQVRDERSYSQLPLYSTLPDSNDMIQLASYQNIRMAARSNQSIIMVNNGPGGKGFSVCQDCGASMPVSSEIPFGQHLRRYKSKYVRGRCSHQDVVEVDLGYDFITDMLVLEVTVDPEKINVREQYNLWLSRAAQSLAEAIRLAVGKELDIEFGELITGSRHRDQGQSAYIEIYLYDSLSSGAGYAVSVADSIEHILDVTRHLLLNCDCPTACQSCLKHYRNQNIHGILDRFAALELLDWSESNIISKSLTIEEQLEQLYPLEHVLEPYRIKLSSSQNGIIATCGTKTRQIVIYPSMWCQPTDSNTVFVSNAYTKHAKPYAVRKITGAFGF